MSDHPTAPTYTDPAVLAAVAGVTRSDVVDDVHDEYASEAMDTALSGYDLAAEDRAGEIAYDMAEETDRD